MKGTWPIEQLRSDIIRNKVYTRTTCRYCTEQATRNSIDLFLDLLFR